MQSAARDLMRRTAITACLLLSSVVFAQSSTHPVQHDSVNLHHVQQYELMKQMTAEMNDMTAQVEHGDLTAEQRKQLAQRMAVLSRLMRRMAGLDLRPAMKDADFDREMVQMRKDMDDFRGIAARK